MKNRKTIVVAFMLCAVMLLGVGYAVLTDTLNILGDAEVSQANAENAFDEEVYFSAASEGEGYRAWITTGNDDKAEFEVTGLGGEGDYVDITYTIQNDNDFAVSVLIDPTNTQTTNTTFFTCTSNKGNEAFTIEANSSETVVIRVSMIATPTLAENQTVSCVFSVEYDVTSVGDNVGSNG